MVWYVVSIPVGREVFWGYDLRQLTLQVSLGDQIVVLILAFAD